MLFSLFSKQRRTIRPWCHIAQSWQDDENEAGWHVYLEPSLHRTKDLDPFSVSHLACLNLVNWEILASVLNILNKCISFLDVLKTYLLIQWTMLGKIPMKIMTNLFPSFFAFFRFYVCLFLHSPKSNFFRSKTTRKANEGGSSVFQYDTILRGNEMNSRGVLK